MSRAGWSAAVAVVGVVLVACGGGRRGPAPLGPGGDSLLIEVNNQNFYDATIYAAFSSSVRRRLGTVTGNSRANFKLGWQPTPLVFTVDFIGAGEVGTDRMTADPGEIIELTLPPDAHRTAGLVRRRRN